MILNDVDKLILEMTSQRLSNSLSWLKNNKEMAAAGVGAGVLTTGSLGSSGPSWGGTIHHITSLPRYVRNVQFYAPMIKNIGSAAFNAAGNKVSQYV